MSATKTFEAQAVLIADEGDEGRQGGPGSPLAMRAMGTAEREAYCPVAERATKTAGYRKISAFFSEQ